MTENERMNRIGDEVVESLADGRMVRRSWLSYTVSKKGNRVLAWSIGMPNGRCPFASKICSKYCYAMGGQFGLHEERYAENYEFTSDPGFVDTMTSEIVQFVEHHPDEHISVAIHEKGEIYSIPYLNKWEEIVSATKDLTNLNYFIYTRAWRSEPFRDALEEMSAKHSNVRVNLSTDSDMVAKFGMPKPIGDGLITYLAETDEDIPPPGVDLVFRNLRIPHKGSLERLGDVLVCPYESELYIGFNGNGKPALTKGKCKPIRCMECRLCIDRSLEEWEKVKGDYAGTPGQAPALDIATPAKETECLFGAEDLPLLLPSDLEETSNPKLEEERLFRDKIERAVTRFQSDVIESCLDAADQGMTITPYTRDRFTNTAIVIYQLANKVLPLREEP